MASGQQRLSDYRFIITHGTRGWLFARKLAFTVITLGYVLSRKALASVGKASDQALELTLVEAATEQASISLLSLVPLSVLGLGITQAADVYLLGLLGIEPGVGLAVCLIRLAIAYGYMLLGAVLFVRCKEGRKSWSARCVPGSQLGHKHGTDSAAPQAKKVPQPQRAHVDIF